MVSEVSNANVVESISANASRAFHTGSCCRRHLDECPRDPYARPQPITAVAFRHNATGIAPTAFTINGPRCQ